jgi:hypothetical protein
LQPFLQPVLQRCSRNVLGMNLLIAIRSEFQSTANSREARRALARLAEHHPTLAGYTNLTDIVDALHTAEPAAQTELLNTLIRHAKNEQLVRLTIVEAFGRLIGGFRRVTIGPDADDYRSDLVTALLTEVDRLAGLEPHPFPSTMLARAVDRADKKWQRLATEAPVLVEDVHDEINGNILISEPDGDSLRPTRIDLFLDTLVSAVRSGELSTEDGTFLARRVLNEEPTSVEAQRRYVSERTALRHLTKAAATLARHHAAAAA